MSNRITVEVNGKKVVMILSPTSMTAREIAIAVDIAMATAREARGEYQQVSN